MCKLCFKYFLVNIKVIKVMADVKQGKVKIKNMETREEKEVDINQLTT